MDLGSDLAIFYWYKDPDDSQVTCNFYFQGKKNKKVVNKSSASI